MPYKNLKIEIVDHRGFVMDTIERRMFIYEGRNLHDMIFLQIGECTYIMDANGRIKRRMCPGELKLGH